MILFQIVIFVYCWVCILFGIIICPMILASWFGAMAYMLFPHWHSFAYGLGTLFLFVMSCAVSFPICRAYLHASGSVFRGEEA